MKIFLPSLFVDPHIQVVHFCAKNNVLADLLSTKTVFNG